MFWIGVAGFVLLVLAVGGLLTLRRGAERSPLERLQDLMGLRNFHPAAFLVIFVFWGVLFILLFSGLVGLIIATLAQGVPVTPDAQQDWRFALTKLTALMAVLAAVVAFPVTLVRINLTRAQNRTAEESLYNDKINAAVEDLHAQRQVTKWLKDGDGNITGVLSGWEDDITRRNAAIDRLKGLVEEDPSLSPRVIRMLSVYVREVSRENGNADEPKEGLL